jgi:hypothetical protein
VCGPDAARQWPGPARIDEMALMLALNAPNALAIHGKGPVPGPVRPSGARLRPDLPTGAASSPLPGPVGELFRVCSD